MVIWVYWYHIPIVEQLRPGLLEIISKGGETEQYFVSGGIAMVQPGNKLTISAIEAFKPDQIDASAVKNLIADAQRGLNQVMRLLLLKQTLSWRSWKLCNMLLNKEIGN